MKMSISETKGIWKSSEAVGLLSRTQLRTIQGGGKPKIGDRVMYHLGPGEPWVTEEYQILYDKKGKKIGEGWVRIH